MLIKKIFKIFLAFVCVFISQIILADQYLLKPTGEYGVGFQDFRLVNGRYENGIYSCPGKTDLLYSIGYEQDYGMDNQKDFCRETMVRVYYPVYQQAQPVYAKYYQPAMVDMQHIITAAKVPGVTQEELNALTQVNSFTVQNAVPIVKQFPVLIFDPGSTVEAEQYENMITQLVSQGYIVLAINNTLIGSSILFPDGRLVHNRPDLISIVPKADGAVFNDILFVRNELNNSSTPLAKFFPYMQFNHIGLFGHSMGGISVVAVIRQYPKLFQAALSLDAPPTKLGERTYSPTELAGFPETPFLRLFAAEWRSLINTPVNAQFQLFINNYYVLLSPSETDTDYTGHMSFSDLSTLQYLTAINLYLKYAAPDMVGSADGWHEASLLNNYVQQFFDLYLKNMPSSTFTNCKTLSTDSLITCANK